MIYREKEMVESMSKEAFLFASEHFDSERLMQYILIDRNNLIEKGTK